jgi:hypothetical protein
MVDTSTPETRRLKEWDGRRFVRMSSVALGWMVVLAIIAVMWGLLGKPSWLEAINAGTVAQIVPSIVVAIFVFAVGTAFVMCRSCRRRGGRGRQPRCRGDGCFGPSRLPWG